MGFLKEFKEFAFKGNMIDLAVGMIVGSAFTALVNDLIKDIAMPVLSLATGRMDFENMFFPMAGQTTKVLAEAQEQGSVLAYGAFVTAVINFLVMALVVFLFVKLMNHARRKEELPAVETEKACPYCRTRIDIHATRCPHCTSLLSGYHNPEESRSDLKQIPGRPAEDGKIS